MLYDFNSMGELRNLFSRVCSGFILIASVHVCLCSESSDNVEEFHMVQDKSFSNVTIYDMNVTCGQHRPGLFPSQTWTCNDIRVNGMRMAYGYYPGLGADSKCTESGGFDELRQLCYKLMESIASNRQLWGAQVSKASCDYIDEKRVMLNLSLDGYYWKIMKPGYGWIETLQCVAFPKDDAFPFP